MLSCYIETSRGVATRRPCPTRCVVAILKAEAKGRNWGELLGRDWRDDWQAMLGSGVHKDAVTGIIEKHIKDPALVKRLADAWDSAVDLGVTTAKASPAQKKKKTDRAIRLTSVRQATSVLLSQIGLIACKWCVYRGLHDCCLTTKKQFGQLGDSELCAAAG